MALNFSKLPHNLIKVPSLVHYFCDKIDVSTMQGFMQRSISLSRYYRLNGKTTSASRLFFIQ